MRAFCMVLYRGQRVFENRASRVGARQLPRSLLERSAWRGSRQWYVQGRFFKSSNAASARRRRRCHGVEYSVSRATWFSSLTRRVPATGISTVATNYNSINRGSGQIAPQRRLARSCGRIVRAWALLHLSLPSPFAPLAHQQQPPRHQGAWMRTGTMPHARDPAASAARGAPRLSRRPDPPPPRPSTPRRQPP